jgi:hypothetical protein
MLEGRKDLDKGRNKGTRLDKEKQRGKKSRKKKGRTKKKYEEGREHLRIKHQLINNNYKKGRYKNEEIEKQKRRTRILGTILGRRKH